MLFWLLTRLQDWRGTSIGGKPLLLATRFIFLKPDAAAVTPGAIR